MLHKLKELQSLLIGVDTVEDLLAHSSAFIARAFNLDLISIFANYKGQSFAFEYEAAKHSGVNLLGSKLRFESGQVLLNNQILQMPCYVKRAEDSELTKYLTRATLEAPRSFCLVPILYLGTLLGWVECQKFATRHPWTAKQRSTLEKITSLIAHALEHTLPSSNNEPDDITYESSEDRIVNSNWVTIELLPDGRILRASHGIFNLLGISAGNVRSSSIYDLLEKVLVQSSNVEILTKIKAVIAGQAAFSDLYAEIVNSNSKQIYGCRFQIERAWRRSKRITLIISKSNNAKQSQDSIDEIKQRSSRLVEYGNLIILRTDLQLRITDILGDTTRVFGIAAEELLHKPAVWNRLLNTEDFRRLLIKMRDFGDKPVEFEQQIQLVNIQTQKQQHLFLTAIPIFSTSGKHIGWEGYGVDITEKVRVEEEVKKQNRRIEALYEIAKTTQSNIDPAFVALRGLKALMTATKSVFGHCVMYDRTTDVMEILATVGCDHEYVEGLTQVMGKPNLSRDVIASNKGMLIDDVRICPNARYGLAARAGARACIAMPLAYQDPDEGQVVIGALQIASRRVSKYTQEDFELVAAAAAQMAASIRQADFHAMEKREASSLATLYKLSHVLTRVQDLEEIGENAFPILMSEIACRRVWLGVVNEQGTHIAGMSAYGPGITERVARIQIELNLRHDFIDEVIRTKQAVIVPAGTQMECSLLNNIIERLKPSTLVLVPLVVLGNVVGVLIVEPVVASNAFLARKLSLLISIANEMATVVMARRLETKIAESEKMRMAGLISAGVAHNFNNLLQAVMGQASLLSMQVPDNSPLKASIDNIADSAQRGADLIKKMSSLSESSTSKRQTLQADELINSQIDLFASLLGRSVDLQVNLAQDLPPIDADPKQIQQVLSSLVVNARDALAGRVDAQVVITASKVRLKTAEVDPELSPGEYLVLTVSDNGQGMDAEQVKRCFEPFYSSKNVDRRTGVAFDGSGFGLYLSYTVIKQHGGIILANSQSGAGSQFSIYLPAAIVPALEPIERLKIEKIHDNKLISEVEQPLVVNSGFTEPITEAQKANKNE